MLRELRPSASAVLAGKRGGGADCQVRKWWEIAATKVDLAA